MGLARPRLLEDRDRSNKTGSTAWTDQSQLRMRVCRGRTFPYREGREGREEEGTKNEVRRTLFSVVLKAPIKFFIYKILTIVRSHSQRVVT